MIVSENNHKGIDKPLWTNKESAVNFSENPTITSTDQFSLQPVAEKTIPRIIVIDERPIFRGGLVAAISTIMSETHLTDVSDIQALDETVEEGLTIVLLGVDRLSMPQIKAQVSKIRQSKFFSRIIFYDFGNPIETLAKYVGLGIYGILTRHFDNQELEKCLKAVLNDKKFLSDEMLSVFFDSYRKLNANNRRPLTKTETVVASHLIVGKNVSWIAKTLDRKLSTISTIKSNIYKKMGVSNVIDLQRVLSEDD